MAFSSLYSAMILGVATLIVVSGLWLAQSDNSESGLALKERSKILGEAGRESISIVGFNSTNVTAMKINVTLYLINSGSTDMRTDCIGLYVDGAWVDRANLVAAISERAYDPGLWNPTENMLLSDSSVITVGEHNGTVESCTGFTVSGRFNASICGDGYCLGGEYCGRDDSSCPKNVCHTPICLNGCGQTNITDGEDDGYCDSTNSAGVCLSPPCQCDGSSKCCGLTEADCAGPANCCSATCTDNKCV